MPTNPVHHTWIQRILELRSGQRNTKLSNFVWLMIGVYQSCSALLCQNLVSAQNADYFGGRHRI